MDVRPLIATLRLDPESHEWFDAQRRRHFPADRNFLSAHLTLFHALPAAVLDDVRERCRREALREAFPIGVIGVRSLGRGVAYVIASPELADLRAALARDWGAHLSAQDSQPFAPHVTIQNKVDPATARALFTTLRDAFQPRTAHACGLDLWRYDGGPWAPVESTRFRNAPLPVA